MRNKYYLKLSKTAVIKLLETIQTALEETYNNIDLKTKTLSVCTLRKVLKL